MNYKLLGKSGLRVSELYLGACTLPQFEDNLRCLKWTLNAKQLTQLDKASRIEMGFPTDFLRLKEVHEFLHGGTFDRIERRWT